MVATLASPHPDPALVPTCRVADQNVRCRNSTLIWTPTAARKREDGQAACFGEGVVGGERQPEKMLDSSQREEAHPREAGGGERNWGMVAPSLHSHKPEAAPR